VTATLPAWKNDPVKAEKILRVLRKAREKRLPPLEFASPLDLLEAVDPTTTRTPALEHISAALVEAYTRPNGRLMISMPPQEGKSHLATKAATLWYMMRNPEARCGILSYGSELANDFGREIRSWVQTYQGQEGTLDLRMRIAYANNAVARWKLDGHRGGLISVGLGATITGRALDSVVIDDPFASAEDAESETYRKFVWSKWQAVANTRLAPGSPIVIIMTRWHEDDLAGRLLNAEDAAQWRVINIPALANHDPAKGETDPLGRQPGEWMISARGRTTADWEMKRVAVGERVFRALYQQQPTPEAGDILKRHWWRRYTTPIWSTDDGGQTYRFGEPPDELFSSWDMTFKDTKDSDYVVGQVWARYGADAFLVDQVRARLGFTETKAAFDALARKWPQCRVHLIEDKANGPAVISALRKDAPGAVIPVTPVDSKTARASAVAPQVEAGNVFVPADSIALFDQAGNSPESFIAEAAAFPNDAHDDQVDAATQALHRFFIAGAGAAAWIESLRGQTEKKFIVATVDDPEPALVPAPDPNDEFKRAQLRELGW
jgi:predicted phage terminase large subunit-like protein